MNTPLRTAAALMTLGALALLVLIVFSSMEMGLGAGLRATVDTLWGVTTLVDLYVGLVFAAIWIVWREHGRAVSFAWIPALFLLGNLALAAYVIMASLRSQNLHQLFAGTRRAAS